MSRRAAVVALILACAIWGGSFTVIKELLGPASPMRFNAVRFSLAALLLSPTLRGVTARELRGGLVLGFFLWAGFTMQTIGLAETTPSRSGFITGLYVPFVPLVSFVVYRALPRPATLAGVVFAVAGMYLLTGPAAQGGGLNRGDILTLGCAVMFACHIVAVEHFTKGSPVQRLLAVQIGLTGLLSWLTGPLIETARFDPTPHLLITLGFVVVICTVVALHLQLRAQQVLSAERTALIFTLEPVFAALSSFLVLGERLGLVQWAGGALILAAMVVPEIGERRHLGET